MNNDLLSVRPALLDDYKSIVDYFLKADEAFLVGMGIDLLKLPARDTWLQMLKADFYLPLEEKQFFYMIWLADDMPVGHCNINKIVYHQEAHLHLHLWQTQLRVKGLGVQFLTLSLPYFFEMFGLKKLYCEPMAANATPNRTLQKVGFEFIKSYDTTPGWINQYQTVNRWCLSHDAEKER